jgi:TRAP-type C4-dicarboxylate transport system permease large subunit
VIAIALWLYVALRARKLPAPSAQQTPPREVGRLFVVALPAFGLPFVIRGAIVNGVARRPPRSRPSASSTHCWPAG